MTKQRQVKKDYQTAKMLAHWLPKNQVFWLVFDMSNGDSGSKRYVWWFDNKKAAEEHIRHQRRMDGAELSEPHKVKLA